MSPAHEMEGRRSPRVICAALAILVLTFISSFWLCEICACRQIGFPRDLCGELFPSFLEATMFPSQSCGSSYVK